MASQRKPDFVVDRLIGYLRLPWLIVVAVLMLVYYNGIVGQESTTLLPYQAFAFDLMIYVLGLGILYSLGVLGLIFSNWYANWLSVATAFIDISMSLFFFWALGGPMAVVLPVLLFPVITIALRFGFEFSLLAAMPMVILYGLALLLGGVGEDFGMLLSAGADIVTLVFTGFTVGVIAQRKVASENARSQDEIKKLSIESDRAQALYEMANTLSSTLNYQKVLRAMIELAQLALSEADEKQHDYYSTVSMVLLFDEEGPLGELRLVGGRNIPRLDEDRKVTPQGGILAQVIYKAEAIIAGNVQNDPALRQFVALQNSQSILCAPLRAGFDLYGLVIFASPRKQFYNQEHASLLTTFCSQATIALQNAQLYADLEHEQRKLLEKEAQARSELARNLHDGPTQAIATIAMRLDFIRKLVQKGGETEKVVSEIGKVEEIANQTTNDIRTMLFTLRPIVLETQGLKAAIKQYADRLRELNDLDVKVDVNGYDEQLSMQEEGVLFAVIEEAVGNSKKYAQAEHIEVRVDTENDHLVAEVIDDGIGFDLQSVRENYDRRGSLGLINMEERAKMLGGQYQIQSRPGEGTHIRIRIPLNQ